MVNTAMLHGRLTADPKLKTTQSGVSVTSFTLAVKRDFTKEDVTDFITCVAWRQTAEFICKYFGKGREMLVQGSIQTRKYQDRDGNNRTATEILVNNMDFCGSKSGNSETRQNEPAVVSDAVNPMNEELPF